MVPCRSSRPPGLFLADLRELCVALILFFFFFHAREKLLFKEI